MRTGCRSLFLGFCLLVSSVLPLQVTHALDSSGLELDCQSATVLCVDILESSNQEYETIQSAVDSATPGDTVLVFEGEYAGFKVNSSGTISQPITIRAEGDSVTIDGSGRVGIDISGQSHIGIDGFFVRNCGEVACISVTGQNEEQLNDGISFSNMGVMGSVVSSQYRSAWRLDYTVNAVLEDIWGFGSGASILHISNSDKLVLRRAVLRWDNGGGSDYYKPSLKISNVINSYFENILLLDGGDQSKTGFLLTGFDSSGRFESTGFERTNFESISIESASVESTETSRFSASKNNQFKGLIALNNAGVGFFVEAGSSEEGNLFENVISWGNNTGIASNDQSNHTLMNHLTIGNNRSSATWFNPYANVNNNKLSNSGVYNNDGTGINGNLSYDYNNVFGNKGGDYYYNDPAEHDISIEPKIRYITRTELDSPNKGIASDGLDIGATVVNRYENGVLTEQPLWPWVNESRIKRDICDAAALSNLERTGSNSAVWCSTEKSLSQYVWEAQGSPCPVEICQSPSGPKLDADVVSLVNNGNWTTINLNKSYDSMVVVATPVYAETSVPLVVRISNVTERQFDIRVQRADGKDAEVDAVDVHYLVAEEGVYNLQDHGIKMEAARFISKVTDRSGSWRGESRDYQQSYSHPVILGQVMSNQDERFSVFWSRGKKRAVPADSESLRLGKHIGEDTDRQRANETIGYIVIEEGVGQTEGFDYQAGRGSDTILGMDQAAGEGQNPRSYSIDLDNPSVAIASQTAMDGSNGGWAVLYGQNYGQSHGQNLLQHMSVELVIDEDQIKDTERWHTTEQVDFIVLGKPIIDEESPSAPIGLTTDLSADSVELSWEASSDNVGVADYVISRNNEQIGISSDLHYLDTNLSLGTTYRYEVAARDKSGNVSLFSDPVLVTLPLPVDDEPPAVPDNLVADTVTDRKISLSWDAAEDNVATIGYYLYRNGSKLASLSSFSFVDTGLSPQTFYQYQVSAFDAAGNQSDLSDVLSVTTQHDLGNPAESFSFVVFGDFNGGGCARNDRVNRLVDMMAENEADAAFYMSTGDIIDGYWSGDSTSCFATDPATIRAAAQCGPGIPNGNMADILTPLKLRPPVEGLNASFYLALGNHDDNWGSGWYPDPCGEGICEFLSPQVPADFINHSFNAGKICALEQSESTYPTNYYYSFSYQNSYFIVLRQNNDYFGMLSCNQHPGYDSCAEYCAAPELYDDAARNSYCFSVAQFDWLREELKKANSQSSKHIFVFAHAPLITSVENHNATHGHQQIRALLESQGVDVFFNGHNHAYERTHPLRGDSIDPNGTVYITTGSGGALTDSVRGDWFTAYSAADMVSYGAPGYADKMTTYLRISVDDQEVTGKLFSLGYDDNPKEEFSLTIPVDQQLMQSDINVSDITSATADLFWETNLAADAWVEYGLSQQQLDKSESTSDVGNNHRISLDNLQADTTYDYRLLNSRGDDQVVSAVASFRTLPQDNSNQLAEIGGCQIFPENNFWNTPVDQLPVHPRSNEYINNIGADTTMHPDFGTRWNGMDIGIAFDVIPNDQPFVDIIFNYWDETDPLDLNNPVKSYPLPDQPSIEGGADNYTQTGDNHVLLVRQDSCILYELFSVLKNGDDLWTAGSGAIWDLNQNEQRPEGVTSADAAGLAILPGLVRYEEVFGDTSSGIEPGINHALRITLRQIQDGYVRPASHSDGRAGHDPSYAPMGQRFRLKADFDISGFDSNIQVILQAMKKYGVVVADTGSDMFLSGAHDDRWDDDLLRQLKSIKASAFEAVYTGEVIDY